MIENFHRLNIIECVLFLYTIRYRYFTLYDVKEFTVYMFQDSIQKYIQFIDKGWYLSTYIRRIQALVYYL